MQMENNKVGHFYTQSFQSSLYIHRMAKGNNSNFKELKAASLREAELMYKLTQKKDNNTLGNFVVEIIGYISGKLPANTFSIELMTKFKVEPEDEVFAIVMRLEAGGSFERVLHPPIGSPPVPMTTWHKLLMLKQIIRAITELHGQGVVHGDLKPRLVMYNMFIMHILIY